MTIEVRNEVKIRSQASFADEIVITPGAIGLGISFRAHNHNKASIPEHEIHVSLNHTDAKALIAVLTRMVTT